MILVDTSIWIDHLRDGDEELVTLLNTSQALTHPFVLGELACGNLKNRTQLLELMAGLAQTTLATDEEVLFFINQYQLMGRGIGYIDAHLLASVSLSAPAQLWTRDKRLSVLASTLNIAYE